MNKQQAVNKWQIDLPEILNNNQTAITNFYETIRPYFIWFFKGDEDLFHKLFLNVYKYIHTYDSSKGSFHNWLLKSAFVLRKQHHLQQLQSPIYFTDKIPEHLSTDSVVPDDSYKQELKTELYKRLARLTETEKQFVIHYVESPEVKTSQQRTKFQRLKKVLQKA